MSNIGKGTLNDEQGISNLEGLVSTGLPGSAGAGGTLAGVP
jgi:hypothetical protein